MTYLQCLTSCTIDGSINVLVLGFYDRDNTGDEMYKIAFRQIFPERVKLTFKCTDDVSEIPEDVDVVVVGGGDVINAYFMDKVLRLVRWFRGRVYALSVGIPYASCARYLEAFDHVYVRSRDDYDVARPVIGSKNVTLLPDACFSLKENRLGQPLSFSVGNKRLPRIGICLANPSTMNNAHFVERLASVLRHLKDVEIHVIPFNMCVASPHECDLQACATFAAGIPGSINHELTRPADAVAQVRNMDLNICMRYHSAVFSLAWGVKTIIVTCSSKLEKLARDTDCRIMSMSMSRKELTTCVTITLVQTTSSSEKRDTQTTLKRWRDAVAQTLVSSKKVKAPLARPPPPRPHEQFLRAMELLNARRSKPVDPHLMCHLAAGNVNSRHLYGLIENMKRRDFNVETALRFIWGDVEQSRVRHATNERERYYPCLNPAKLFVDFDEHVGSDSYHRSGWPFVIEGIMAMHARTACRSPVLYLDTYVDRTFHWGMGAYEAVGAIPYRRSWAGIIHHTFDDSTSEYNNKVLFSREPFLKSLHTCLLLVCLTHHLAMNVRVALDMAGFQKVPVQVVHHPTQVHVRQFKMEALLKAPVRMVIQIGSWLRNSRAIYDLDLHDNKMGLSRGILGVDNNHRVSGAVLGGKGVCGDDARSSFSSYRSCNSANRMNSHASSYMSAFGDRYSQEFANVVIDLGHVSDVEYDGLLSESVVFLNLVDCSAVNTVIECIARTTPIVVNRHPALEEVLGPRYPGFYDDMRRASELLNSGRELERCHAYLRKLDKSFLSIERFVRDLQRHIAGVL